MFSCLWINNHIVLHLPVCLSVCFQTGKLPVGFWSDSVHIFMHIPWVEQSQMTSSLTNIQLCPWPCDPRWPPSPQNVCLSLYIVACLSVNKHRWHQLWPTFDFDIDPGWHTRMHACPSVCACLSVHRHLIPVNFVVNYFLTSRDTCYIFCVKITWIFIIGRELKQPQGEPKRQRNRKWERPKNWRRKGK